MGIVRGLGRHEGAARSFDLDPELDALPTMQDGGKEERYVVYSWERYIWVI